ncbi:MAG: protein kinase, partial [Kofleriaceae bacterium]
LAKMFAAGAQSAVKTAAGVLLGTPQYMSPEACESRATLDHRTDIYALGVLLFQMTTGVLPFDGETMGEILVKQVTQLPPPPRQYNPNLPPSVEQILLRCLMKQPDARFPTMVALREALLDPEGYLRNSPPMAPARSLAPGEIKVDAKTVMAYAAQQQKTRIGVASELPLVSPPSLPGAPSAASQATMISDGSLIPPRRGPDLAVPGMLKTNTMRIATPLGYSSRPPRRVWPIVLIVALLLGLGGGAFAVAWFGKNSEPAATPAAAADAAIATGPAPTHDAAAVLATGSSAPTTAGSAAVPTIATATGSASITITSHPIAMATVDIDSIPAGAEIFGPDNTLLGKTPAKLSLPVGTTPISIELRLPGYHKKAKQLVVSGNLAIQVPLDRIPVIHHGPAGPAGHLGSGGKRGSSDDLERP